PDPPLSPQRPRSLARPLGRGACAPGDGVMRGPLSTGFVFPGTTAQIDAVLFDHDGTLVDTVPGLVAGHNHVAARFACPPLTREDVLLRLGSGSGRQIMTEMYGPGRADEALELFRLH